MAAAQAERAAELAKQRAQKKRRDANRRARAKFVKHKPGNPFAVWELQTGFASDPRCGCVRACVLSFLLCG